MCRLAQLASNEDAASTQRPLSTTHISTHPEIGDMERRKKARVAVSTTPLDTPPSHKRRVESEESLAIPYQAEQDAMEIDDEAAPEEAAEEAEVPMAEVVPTFSAQISVQDTVAIFAEQEPIQEVWLFPAYANVPKRTSH